MHACRIMPVAREYRYYKNGRIAGDLEISLRFVPHVLVG